MDCSKSHCLLCPNISLHSLQGSSTSPPLDLSHSERMVLSLEEITILKHALDRNHSGHLISLSPTRIDQHRDTTVFQCPRNRSWVRYNFTACHLYKISSHLNQYEHRGCPFLHFSAGLKLVDLIQSLDVYAKLKPGTARRILLS